MWTIFRKNLNELRVFNEIKVLVSQININVIKSIHEDMRNIL